MLLVSWIKIENESLTIKDTMPEIALPGESGCLADFAEGDKVIDKYADFFSYKSVAITLELTFSSRN